MSVRCEVCGLEDANYKPSEQWSDGRLLCWRQAMPNPEAALECYRLGYERVAAELAAVCEEQYHAGIERDLA